MARTTNEARKQSLESKALAAETKSDGMRMLLDAGYSVAAISHVFSAPYGFVYGVAKRAGKVETAAKRKAVKGTVPVKAKAPAAHNGKTKAPAPKSAAKAAKPAVRARATRPATAAARPAIETAAAVRASQVAKGKVQGRPSLARRAANRKAAITSGK